MRIFHRFYAWLFGFFWLPCPVCGRMFGGHEIINVSVGYLVCDDGHHRVVCPDQQCSHDAAVLNMERGYIEIVRTNTGCRKVAV
mgnify:CR=1 FL=1